MINYDRQKFGKAVRTLRGPLPPKDFAKRLRTSPAILARVERGREVDDNVVEKVCSILNLNIEDFPAGKAGDTSKSGL